MTDATRTPSVVYVTGRRKALARSLAILVAETDGYVWSMFKDGERERRVDEADEVIRQWVTDGILVEFLAEYRERK